MNQEIQLYSMNTPNGQKVSIALEEMDLPYQAHLVNILKKEQFLPDFVKISPYGKIPAIVDPQGPDGQAISLFESGSILIYLGRKSEKFYPSNPRWQAQVNSWLFLQVGGVGPMLGQFGHFYKFAADKCKDPYPVEHFTEEITRLLKVLDTRLAESAFLAYDEYSVADMATFTWVNAITGKLDAGDKLMVREYKHLTKWRDKILARPKVQVGLKVCEPPQV